MLTVIITTHNDRDILDRTFGSLLAQTTRDFKVIIVDDCSEQDNSDIISRYSNLLDVTYIRNAVNLGCGNSRQVGIDACTTKYFTMLDSDDCFLPYAIKLFNETLELNPNIELLRTYFWAEDFQLENDKKALKIVADKPSFIHGVVYDKTALERNGIRFHPEISRWSEDCYFNMIAYELLYSREVRIPTVVYTNTTGSATHSTWKHAYSKKYYLLKALYEAGKYIISKKGFSTSLDPSISILNKYAPYTEPYEKNMLLRLLELQKQNKNKLAEKNANE